MNDNWPRMQRIALRKRPGPYLIYPMFQLVPILFHVCSTLFGNK
jgi:hypothetical protein